MRFSDDAIPTIRFHLVTEPTNALIEFMYRKHFGGDVSLLPKESAQIALDLGWTDRSGKLTELGHLAADSCREYTFWLQRQRTLPFEGSVEHLSLSFFRTKSVLEVGCGMGANLMSLVGTAHDIAGVEPVEAYSQLGAMFRDREGLPQLDVRTGAAESIPFEDDRFDVVLCVAAHHYFDICAALKEFFRVVKPGGHVLIIGDTLEVEAWLTIKDTLRRPDMLKPFAVSLLNTMSYMAFRRRVLRARGNSTTSRPIFPFRKSMARWLCEAGLRTVDPTIRVGSDTCFYARKPN
jgi:ubiquinone/menaquinone biosynthesis C-methylase UbiE